jgi:uncharacterized protein YceH (UPF0502 family)
MIAVPEPSTDEASPATPFAAQKARPLAVMLPRQPGSREARYAHLLGGPVDTAVRDPTSAELRPRNPSAIDPAAESATAARISALEAEVASLRTAVAQLESRVNAALPAEAIPEDSISLS